MIKGETATVIPVWSAGQRRRRARERTALFWLLVLLAPFLLSAQRYRFKYYSHGYGLKDTEIRCLMQDHTGFLWAGTAGGLFRYDGMRFTRVGEAGMPTSLVESLS